MLFHNPFLLQAASLLRQKKKSQLQLCIPLHVQKWPNWTGSALLATPTVSEKSSVQASKHLARRTVLHLEPFPHAVDYLLLEALQENKSEGD